VARQAAARAARRVARSTPRCTRCREPGHNARSCGRGTRWLTPRKQALLLALADREPWRLEAGRLKSARALELAGLVEERAEGWCLSLAGWKATRALRRRRG
jgi:hypothetical protein